MSNDLRNFIDKQIVATPILDLAIVKRLKVYPSPRYKKKSSKNSLDWEKRMKTDLPKTVSHMITLPSFEALAKRLQEPFKCKGSQARAVMNFVCLVIVQPICFPVLGSQMITFPDLSPEANFESFGAQARARTHPG